MKNLFLTLVFIFSSVVLSAENENKPFFRASKEQPYHLSIGAVLFDQNGRIACHHFKEIFGLKDIYILMRESIENNETPLMTLHRGLKEEFGAIAKPFAFLGCLIGYFPHPLPSFSIEKTTLYIACQLIHWDPKDRDLEDPEASSTIEWLEPSVLISLMEKQGLRFQHRTGADESEMIKRALPYLSLKN
ncbi:MAG: NUDIX hydrolase [Chlamydiae bacterium]|nr:NUDIX hydrolase [Chlamydiota bacterium]